ncbi:MAG: peptidoglycan bridge formation glycyltransferase FemA/FemB family protein [Anaerolineales bacterium]|nr:peptidoglycan bridge formation glycyltransferase FemA/FemB family protein [Anaerolineales bacterium]
MVEKTLSEWNQWLTGFPEAHLLQQGEWGALKADFGWEAVRLVSGGAGAQVLFRSLPLGLSLAYIPKGPVGAEWARLWPEINAVCRARRAVFLKVEPDAWQDQFDRQDLLREFGFQPSTHSLQPRRTAVVDIAGEEEEVLARMKQKTRYNIRLAARKDVVVRPSDDLETFSALMEVTGERDAFGVHSLAYYRRVYHLFHPLGMCELLVASYQGQPLAGIMVFAHGKRSWYLYGASNNLERNRMPAYLAQWEAIRWARGKGCTSYDLWGVPDADPEVLEAGFNQRSDGLWGVYRFKRGFGGQIRRAAGAWDKIYHRAAYRAYQLLIARRGVD